LLIRGALSDDRTGLSFARVTVSSNKSVVNIYEDNEVMTMKMFAILDKAKPDIENIRGLNLATVRHTTVQVTRLLL
jgi:hypothetical protein